METADSSWKGGSIPRAVLGRFQGVCSRLDPKIVTLPLALMSCCQKHSTRGNALCLCLWSVDLIPGWRAH
ncbi:hypothetical protein Y1Q_0014063 [Alligator mississippiensis]|uniref:Uncharacterized protein n=1 Tax=Alligator mississippiensis TaxID=8496 RepID=A0A151NVC2_ALLMI|nr:hypothetical protein Y1Q_0014063 [Alligator mississippiensis]